MKHFLIISLIFGESGPTLRNKKLFWCELFLLLRHNIHNFLSGILSEPRPFGLTAGSGDVPVILIQEPRETRAGGVSPGLSQASIQGASEESYRVASWEM